MTIDQAEIERLAEATIRDWRGASRERIDAAVEEYRALKKRIGEKIVEQADTPLVVSGNVATSKGV